MKFNLKPYILVCIVLFFFFIFIYHFFSLSSVIYREGMQLNGVDVSGTKIAVNGSINDSSLMLTNNPTTTINTGDLLMTSAGNPIKSVSGNPISVESGSGLAYALSETPIDVKFNTIENYIIFSIQSPEKKSDETSSKQVSVNGKIDMSLNFILTTKPNLDIQKGNTLLFSNGDKVKDVSNNVIRIASGNGLLYTLSGAPSQDYDLYNKTKDYIVDTTLSSP